MASEFSTGFPEDIEKDADEVLALANISAATRSRFNADAAKLSEQEYLALGALATGEPLSAGDIQREIGVLPAQMSRILRSLEKQESDTPYIDCRINPSDRRRIDVYLTEAGRKVYTDYRRARLGLICDFLANLDPERRVVFMDVMRAFRARIDDRLKSIEDKA